VAQFSTGILAHFSISIYNINAPTCVPSYWKKAIITISALPKHP
jgi:hypothetical protein